MNRQNKVGKAFSLSDTGIVVVEIDVSGALSVASYKLLIAGGPLVLGVSRQHALEAHADALHVLHWTPSLLA